MPRKKTRPFPSDLSDLIAAFEAAEVEYLVVGGHAMSAHARPRATKDLDLWVAGGPNLARVARALEAFGAPAGVIREAATLGPQDVLFFGRPPSRVDILRSIDGVEWDQAVARCVRATLGEHQAVPFIGIDDLIANKKAVGRDQDLIDVKILERTAAPRRKPPRPRR